eukprot:Pgem_evm1s15355
MVQTKKYHLFLLCSKISNLLDYLFSKTENSNEREHSNNTSRQGVGRWVVFDWKSTWRG